MIFNKPTGSVTNKRTGPAGRDASRSTASRWTSAADDDPRQKLVDWMVDPKNPFFARAVANRYWAHFFGRGIVDPLDDMRVTNPPSNPELLDALAKDLVDSKFSLKHLVRTICKSRTYQLSAMPNEFNKHDKQAYARYYPQAAVGRGAVRRGLPGDGQPGDVRRPAARQARPEPGDHAAGRVVPVVLPGRVRPAAADQRLRVRARQRGEPGPGAAPARTREEVQDKLARAGGRADLLAKDTRPDAEKVEELFLLGVRPQADDRAARRWRWRTSPSTRRTRRSPTRTSSGRC